MHRLNFVFWLALSLCSVQISLAQTLQEGTSSVSGKVQGAEGPAVVYLVAQHADPTGYYDGLPGRCRKRWALFLQVYQAWDLPNSCRSNRIHASST